MPYEIKGQCIYKKKTGEKVGCTEGDVHKYMAAMEANVKDETCHKKVNDAKPGVLWHLEKKATKDMTAFSKGDKVKAQQTVQGMQQGNFYVIIDVHKMHTPFGDFVTYEIADQSGKHLAINNGHLVLTRA